MSEKIDVEVIVVAIILIIVLVFGLYLTFDGSFGDEKPDKHDDPAPKVLPDVKLGD